jgi:hypothetical protein
MKTYKFFSLMALLGLSACGSESLNSFSYNGYSTGSNSSTTTNNRSNDSSNSILEALNKPNETTLRGIFNMISKGMISNEITAKIDLEFNMQENYLLTDSNMNTQEYQSSFELELLGDAFLKTNDIMGVFPQALLEVNLEQVDMNSYYSNSEPYTVALNNQKALAYYELGDLYIDFEDAPEMYSFFGFGEANNLKLNGYIGTPEELGIVLPQINEEEINTLVNEFSPVFAGLNSIKTSVTGSKLTSTLELTQTDMVQTIRNVVNNLIKTEYGIDFIESNNLSSDDVESLIEEVVEDIASMFTIRAFKIHLTTNLISGFFESLVVNIDVELLNRSEQQYTNTDYVFNEESFEYEEQEITYNYRNEIMMDLDLDFSLTMKTFSSTQLIAIPINKEEFTGN